MKCPKCGYNSFEYYDRCKKCSDDLISYKQSYNITSLVLPPEAREKLAAQYQSAETIIDNIDDAVKTHDDMFSFDLPDDISSTSEQAIDDPFNFDAPINESTSLKSEDDAFANLLESTSQTETTTSYSTGGEAAIKNTDPMSGPGEFDLESFSWDDTPDVVAAADSKESDDFDSLFGDTTEKDKK